jgi:mono/diheme cytochrome c family protein
MMVDAIEVRIPIRPFARMGRSVPPKGAGLQRGIAVDRRFQMKKTRIAVALAAAAIVAFSGVASAQAKRDVGKREYDSNCAVCHGKLGKGDGPYAGLVDTKAGADITKLSKNNGGVFPILKVSDTIDGRYTVKAHGPRDMPIWGADYLLDARDIASTAEVPFDTETYVKYRIYALVEYVYRLQEK